ncbi:MAG: periplasmic heavy metal sensor [Sphingobacteriales bacterium]|nr:MAG: periplasmic heavy metal sensor [Sphingobacteriales bacterium]
MNKQRFLIISVILLLVLNTATLMFLFFNQRQQQLAPPPQSSANSFIIKELSLTPQQQQQYAQLWQQFQQQLRQLRAADKQLHHQYFDLLKQAPQDTTVIDSVINKISLQRRQMEMALYNHFKQLRQLCTAEQQQKFNQLIDEIMHRMNPRPPGPPPHH